LLAALRCEDPAPTPQFFSLAEGRDRAALATLLQAGRVYRVDDDLVAQLAELLQARQPKPKLSSAEAEARARHHLGGRPVEEYGRWAFFPWSGQLVHLLDRDEFRELRFNRNAYKITPDEQRQLADRRIGVVGLSVGFSVAMALALEGVGGRFRLADFDVLAASNLNRVPAGAAGIGRNKAIVAGQRLLELDPYLEVDVFPGGLQPDNVESFLAAGGRLDLLIEECDDLWLKVFVREAARRLRIPVIMETNDRGMIDVERFDREPERSILHGLMGRTEAAGLKGLVGRQKVPFVLSILDGQRISAALAASLFEIDESLVGWPQLGSGTLLGAATATEAARRVLLDRLTSSGRWYVDLAAILAGDPLPGTAAGVPGEPPVPAPAVAPEHGRLPAQRRPVLDRAAARDAVAHAILAPSGGNRQPWAFHLTSDRRLLCALDEARARSFLDYGNAAGYLSCGAALENLCLRLGASGLRARAHLLPDGSDPCRIATVEVTPGDPEAHDLVLARAIPGRATNRRLGTRVPLPPEAAAALLRVAERGHCRLQLLEPERLDAAGRFLGEVDRFRFLCPTLHRELVSEIRWNAASAEATRDGVDLATLELDELDAAGLRLLAREDVVTILRETGTGSALGRGAQNAVAAASTVALLSIDREGADAFVEGGRVMERIWLEATGLRLAMQPMSVAPYLFRRLNRAAGDGFSESERRRLKELQESFLGLFPHAADQNDLLLFRLGVAPPATVASLRRPVDAVFSADE
jgi:nitroreductase